MAARNACARTLRADGRREEATLVASVRRPSWVDWALNRAADDDPDAANAFADAADAMREAQAAAVEGRRAEVGAALRTLRDRTAQLVRLAKAALVAAGRPSDVADLTERAGAVAADAVACRQLRSAALRADDHDPVAPIDAIAGLPPTTSTSTSTSTPRARPRQAPDAAGAERAAERRSLMRELADTERAHRTAAHELERSERAVVDAEARRTTAVEAVARATLDLDEAVARLDAATERRSSLERDVAAAHQRAIALRGRLDGLAVDG